MDNLEFSEAEIQQQLELLGYKNISREKLQEFKRDLDNLIRSGEWTTLVSPESSGIEITNPSPPAFTKEKVSRSSFSEGFFLHPQNKDHDVRVLAAQNRQVAPPVGQLDSYSRHSVAPKGPVFVGCPKRIQTELDLEDTLHTDSYMSTPVSSEGRRLVKRKVLRKHRGQSLVCDESVFSEDSETEDEEDNVQKGFTTNLEPAEVSKVETKSCSSEEVIECFVAKNDCDDSKSKDRSCNEATGDESSEERDQNMSGSLERCGSGGDSWEECGSEEEETEGEFQSGGLRGTGQRETDSTPGAVGEEGAKSEPQSHTGGDENEHLETTSGEGLDSSGPESSAGESSNERRKRWRDLGDDSSMNEETSSEYEEDDRDGREKWSVDSDDDSRAQSDGKMSEKSRGTESSGSQSSREEDDPCKDGNTDSEKPREPSHECDLPNSGANLEKDKNNLILEKVGATASCGDFKSGESLDCGGNGSSEGGPGAECKASEDERKLWSRDTFYDRSERCVTYGDGGSRPNESDAQEAAAEREGQLRVSNAGGTEEKSPKKTSKVFSEDSSSGSDGDSGNNASRANRQGAKVKCENGVRSAIEPRKVKSHKEESGFMRGPSSEEPEVASLSGESQEAEVRGTRATDFTDAGPDREGRNGEHSQSTTCSDVTREEKTKRCVSEERHMINKTDEEVVEAKTERGIPEDCLGTVSVEEGSAQQDARRGCFDDSNKELRCSEVVGDTCRQTSDVETPKALTDRAHVETETNENDQQDLKDSFVVEHSEMRSNWTREQLEHERAGFGSLSGGGGCHNAGRDSEDGEEEVVERWFNEDAGKSQHSVIRQSDQGRRGLGNAVEDEENSPSESPAASLLTSGYGTMRSERPADDDGLTLHEFDKDSLYSFGVSEHEAAETHGGSKVDKVCERRTFAEDEFWDGRRSEEGMEPEGVGRVGAQVCLERAGSTEDEDDSSSRDIKFIDSKVDASGTSHQTVFKEWVGNLRQSTEGASCLEERLADLHLSAQREVENQGRSSHTESPSSESLSEGAFESYVRGLSRSQDDGDIRPKPKSFIRPALGPTGPKKTDPVAKYFQYKQLWDVFKLPGEDDRKALRWEIRERLAHQPPPPKPRKVLVPNTYTVPTEKKRSALRWEIRNDLATGNIPHSYNYRF